MKQRIPIRRLVFGGAIALAMTSGPSLFSSSTDSMGWGSAASAQKAAPIAGEVLVVLANEKAGKVDPALKAIGALRRAPFSSFKSMSILERPKIKLGLKKPTDVSLPNGRKIQVLVERELPDGRYLVKVSINKPGKKDYLRLLQVSTSPGDPFFVVGQTHAGGTLVVGITVGEKKTAAAKKK